MIRGNKIIDFIENHRYGVIVTVIVHVAIFLFLQIATYQEGIAYNPWDFESVLKEAPDDILITADQIETPQEQELFNNMPEVTSFVKDENDSREKSTDAKTRFTSYARYENPEKLEDEYEKGIKDQLKKERADREKANAKDELQKKPANESKENSKSGKTASSKAVAGETMVSYSLKNRHPLNHNDWNVRNPGYTCGNVNGTVSVMITVDEGGNVLNATLLEAESQNATQCMKNKAREYALKSRFNYDSSAGKRQEGTITYRFVYRE